jgi:translocation and assembly module TamA
VGGFNSIRGYDYQLAGNLDQKRPVGGRSLLETSIELRKKIKDNIGVVAFFDSGNNYDSLTPTLSNKKLYNGLGLGIRYHTDFAPLRADIAIPLNRRKGVDRAFQFYFGIGQSF